MSTLRSKDRASLCTFTFADARRCRTPRFSGHPHLCYFHALKESQANTALTIGRNIGHRFSRSYLSACDLTSALGQVFSGVTQGSVKRKTAATLAYLGQTMLNSIQVAQHEYINTFGANRWRDTIYDSVTSASENEAVEDDDRSAAQESSEPAAATSAK